jgi:PST family polysaccharide transporter
VSARSLPVAGPRRAAAGPAPRSGAAGNVLWLLGADAVGKALALVSLTVVARALGPGEFGIYAYAFSLAALLAILGHLGLESLMIRDLAARPGRAAETLGTVFLLRSAGHAAAAAILLGYGLFLPGHLPAERLVFAVAALGLLLAVLPAVLGGWFKARQQARAPALASICTMAVAAGLKIAAALAGAGVVAVAAGQVAGMAAGALLLALLYRAADGPHPRDWRPSARRAGTLLAESWKLLLAGLFALVYMKIDIAMLRLLVGPEGAGLYAVPAALVLSLHALPAAVSTALFPGMVREWHADIDAFWRSMHLGIATLALVAYGLILAIAHLGPDALRLMAGDAYDPAGPSFVILAFALPFAFARHMITRWIVLKGEGLILAWSEGVGAAANIILNLLLIPALGLVGAAIATVLSHAVASLLSIGLASSRRRMATTLLLGHLNPLGPLLARLAQRP